MITPIYNLRLDCSTIEISEADKLDVLMLSLTKLNEKIKDLKQSA